MSVVIKGERELRRSIEGIEYVFTDREAQKIHAKAAEVLVHEIHKRAPVGLTGNLAESIGTVKSGKNNKRELGLVETGARRKGGFKGFTAHLNEFGTKQRRVKKRHPIFGFDRGKMTAKPFIAPSWENKKDEVLGRVTKGYSDAVVKHLRRTVPR